VEREAVHFDGQLCLSPEEVELIPVKRDVELGRGQLRLSYQVKEPLLSFRAYERRLTRARE
jgi:hypothetical protein